MYQIIPPIRNVPNQIQGRGSSKFDFLYSGCCYTWVSFAPAYILDKNQSTRPLPSLTPRASANSNRISCLCLLRSNSTSSSCFFYLCCKNLPCFLLTGLDKGATLALTFFYSRVLSYRRDFVVYFFQAIQ